MVCSSDVVGTYQDRMSKDRAHVSMRLERCWKHSREREASKDSTWLAVDPDNIRRVMLTADKGTASQWEARKQYLPRPTTMPLGAYGANDMQASSFNHVVQ